MLTAKPQACMHKQPNRCCGGSLSSVSKVLPALAARDAFQRRPQGHRHARREQAGARVEASHETASAMAGEKRRLK